MLPVRNDGCQGPLPRRVLAPSSRALSKKGPDTQSSTVTFESLENIVSHHNAGGADNTRSCCRENAKRCSDSSRYLSRNMKGDVTVSDLQTFQKVNDHDVLVVMIEKVRRTITSSACGHVRVQSLRLRPCPRAW